MIDLNDEKKAKALLNEWCKKGMESISTPVKYSQLLDLMNRLASAEKDAARYRFMRDMSDEVDVSRFFHVELSERDAEIDEAMQCSK